MSAYHCREAILPGHDRGVTQRTAEIRHQRGGQPKERRPVRVGGHSDQYFPWMHHLGLAQCVGDACRPTRHTGGGTDTANLSHSRILGRCRPTIPVDPGLWFGWHPNQVRWRDLPVRLVLDLALGDLWAERSSQSKAPQGQFLQR